MEYHRRHTFIDMDYPPEPVHSSISTNHLLVEFRFQTTKRLLKYNNVGLLESVTETQEQETSKTICLESSALFADLKQFVDVELASYDITPRSRQQRLSSLLTSFALLRWKKFIVVGIREVLEIRLIERTLQESFEESDGVDMVPTSMDTIMSLQKKEMEYKKDGTELESCTICLEDISMGSVVSTLPCRHVFHGDCISSWLKRSHYCPICRFEMPIAVD
ncbi:probable E3 ubiquitin- ligase RHY1A [Olea europaea subsp. europaea]|uniref:RING-type E3 ubiquitin transferase n=1 Tax=Olea europaea subsp. europaea TaxID=158383 RepID=A0A8S0VFU5_OLEEU|nr:probable E3 ubiquitin- ligase RHY1A [Olea europaea subsp. europaea]